MIELENLNLIPRLLEEIESMRNTMSLNIQKRWFSTKELAEYLGYSNDSIYKIKEQHLIEGEHFFNKTGKLLFDRIAIDAWILDKEDDDEAHKQQRQIVDNVLSSL